jgi:DNA modification methylase
MNPTWQTDDGRVKLWLADCLDVLPTLEAGSVDAVVTDPPYGMGDLLTRAATGSRWKRNFEQGPLAWDREAPAALVRKWLEIATDAIVWGGQFFELPPARGWLVWNKIIRNWSSSECELAWTSVEQPNRAFDYSHGQLAHENKQHPTQKPLPLMEWCLGFVPNADTIADPFMGSGTTGVACVRLGRKFLGVEKEPKYFEIAKRRIIAELERMPLFEDKPTYRQSELIGATP